MCFWSGKDGGTTGVVEGDEEVEEEEVGERLAHRDGRRRLAGRAGLEKFFWMEAEKQDLSFSCGETNELTFRMITPFYHQSNSPTQILYIVSRVPSVVFLTLGKTTSIFQTGRLIDSAPSWKNNKAKKTQFLLVKRKANTLKYLTRAVAQLPLHRIF